MSGISTLTEALPGYQSIPKKLNEVISKVAQSALVTVKVAVTADATGGKTFTVPYNMELVDVAVHCTTTNASGTLTVRRSTTVISSAVTCATAGVKSLSTTIVQAEKSLVAGTTYNVIANGAADRGEVYLIGILN